VLATPFVPPTPGVEGVVVEVVELFTIEVDAERTVDMVERGEGSTAIDGAEELDSTPTASLRD